MRFWRSLFDDSSKLKIIARLKNLQPESKARWGKMDAPRMVSHLTNQMYHTLGDSSVESQARFPWLLPARFASIYLVPWPRGRVQGPSEAHITQSFSWETNVQNLIHLLERFALRNPQDQWPEHPLLGPMTGRDWGVFCYKHFNHHLRQFGV